MIDVENLVKRYRDLRRGRPPELQGRGGRDPRLPRAQRRRQVDDHAHPHRLPAGERGTVKVAGLDVFEKPLEVKRQVGYLPELPPLYVDMTVSAYLKFVARLKGVESSGSRVEVERVAHLTSATKCSTGSSPTSPRATAARGPGAGAAQRSRSPDPRRAHRRPGSQADHEVRDLIKSLAGKHTIVLSTHIMQEVSATCQKVLIINQGKLVAYDTSRACRRRTRARSPPTATPAPPRPSKKSS